MSAYITCSVCDCDLVRDDYFEHRQALEARFGDPVAGNWTVELQCPTCAKFTKHQRQRLERENSILRSALLDEFTEKAFILEPDLDEAEVANRARHWLAITLGDETEDAA